jgi:general secretion pathway protein D
MLDLPIKQVEIATKFLQIQTNLNKAFGINWSVDNGSLGFFDEGLTPGGGESQITFTRGNFTATLQALLSTGRAQLINEPRVTCQNNQEAEVEFETQIPYYTGSTTYNQFGFGTTTYTVQAVSVTSGLEVTPRINKDDSVTMALEPQIEDQVGTVTAPDGSSTVPIITEETVETQVTVNDGETLVIGGLIRRNDTVTLNKTPLLSDIPVIGNLFTGNSYANTDSELVIMVTPHIVRDLPKD